MTQPSPELRTKQQELPLEAGGALSPLPQRTLVRRRRLMRFGGLFAVLLGLGLSVIPSPKGSSHVVKTTVENGATAQVHQYFFSRPVGLPFPTGRVDYNDDGSIKSISFEGNGFMGNVAVAVLITIIGSVYFGRRRRDD